MTVWRPPPPSASVGDWDYIATYVATSTPDGIVGEWVNGLPGPDVRAAAAEFAARSRGAFREGRHIDRMRVSASARETHAARCVGPRGRLLAVGLDFGPSSAPAVTRR
jgi:hypothetical protein